MAGYVQFGIQSQRRLTRIYTDTKSSLDFVSKPAVTEDDELKKLHRKLRIQKDRLATWGLRWSRPTEATDSSLVANDDIDESLSRAGLADVVGSIMATIKDILTEAEPLWAASGTANVGISSRAAEKSAAAKMLLVRWDSSRFGDLVKDLTSSIDTLYDISRMRHGETRKPKSKKSIELVVRPEKAFEKARMDTPQLVDPKRLRDFNGGGIVSLNDDGSESLRVEGGKQILCLEADTSDQQIFTRERPVLVEFAAYDSLYSYTGITPPMTRFEKLFNALQRDEGGPEKADFGSLKLIGYFEESQNARFALVYELPEHAKAGLHMGVRKSHYPTPYYARLTDVLSHRSLEPPLEVKYRLAYNVATSVFDLHSRGVVHGNLTLSAVTFFETHVPGLPAQVQTGDDGVVTGADDWLTNVDLRRPYLTSYDLFSEAASSDGSRFLEAANITWYRHRLDPRLTSRTSLTMESQQLDLYALALLLVDIGLWGSSQEMQHGITISSIMMNVKEDPASVCKLLAARCGTLYKNAFQACFEVVGSTSRSSHSRSGRVDVDLQKVYGKVLSCLEKCCSIEEGHDSADAAEDRKDSPSALPMNVLDGADFHGSTPKPRNEQVPRDQAPKTRPYRPTRDSFVGLKEEEKPKADIPYWERPAKSGSQALSPPINDVLPPRPQTKRRWESRSRRNESLPPDSTQHQKPFGEAGVPAIEPNVRVPAWIGETDLERKPVLQPTTSGSKVDDTAEDDKDTTWSELDYNDSVFSADDWKSDPTTMSRRTSMSRRTRRSQSQAVQAEEDPTPAEPAEIDSDNIPARKTRVRFEEPSPWLWKSISPDTIASKDEAKVVTVSCSSLRSILRKQTISCLILDLRLPPLYAQSRIRGALNVCVPVLQLADPTFDLAKLASTFSDSEERVQLLRWQEYEYIFVYDTEQKEEDFAGLHTVKKFTDAGWTGRAGILEGGFESFARVRDDLIDWSLPHSMETTDESADGNGIPVLKAAMQSCQGCRRRRIKCDATTTNTWPCSACVGKKLDCFPPSKHLNEPSGMADREQLGQKEAGWAGTDSTAFNTCAMQGIEVINHGIERARKHLNELYSLADKDQANQKEAERADAELNSLRVQRRIAVMNLSKKDQLGTDEHHASSSTVAEGGGPDANPTQDSAKENAQNVAAAENIKFSDKDEAEAEAEPKEKPRRFPAMKIMQEHLDIWHKCLMPQINEALRSFYRKHSKESVEISLETIGESPQKAKPTILVICTSVGKVKSVLKRSFNYDAATYGLMVCKGQIVRSGARKRRPRRSMLRGGDTHYEGKNTHHQQRPLNGASIGAHCEGQALPAVSFGGMVMIDGEPFGMSVHHMLDVPSDDEYDRDDDFSIATIRSSEIDSYALQGPFLPDAPEHGFELSDYDSETASYVSSEYDSDSEAEKEPGDIGGIDPENCQEGYLITQPAFEDICDDYFRGTEHMDEYLDNYTVGRLHASSGIRRRYHGDGPPHEIDWALFRFNEDRMPTGNHIIGASTYCSTKTDYPTSCVPFDDLASRQVHAIGRTTGLTGGHVLEARAIVKFQGRVTPAQSYAISGGLGVPGDSGAWIMENKKGRACGHVLAWSEKNNVAYFSPMEVMLEDIKETLGVKSVGFPEVKVESPKMKLDEYVPIDNSLAELTDGLNIQSVDRNDRPYGSRTQSMRPMTPRSAKGQRKSSSSDLDIISGMEGMCLSGGRILQSSAL